MKPVSPMPGSLILLLLSPLFLSAPISHAQSSLSSETNSQRRVINVKGGPESVIWVVQLSDLHFSVHHPDRALDFKNLVGPALSMINPSLILITGDLAGPIALASLMIYLHLLDGKSKDMLMMKQNEDEWVEYKNVMDDVVKRSGLDKSIFYDLRGNHDNFGVPLVGGSFDFFSKYSINGQLGRSGPVNSVTLQSGEQKHLFVGLDSTMSIGLRGPTNLFGHPTEKLLAELDSELSQWNSLSYKPISKISFGHFPLSFSASSESGKSLKDVFLKHSLSAYLCGHLHTTFGKNLKRHHLLGHRFQSIQNFFQFNIHQVPSESSRNCSFGAPPVEEFWEWEMGDWRKSRAMRILAIDRGHVSFLDIDFKSGTKKTIVLPTFPLDSRFMSTSSWNHKYECEYMLPSSYETIRALVFSVSPIVSVVARIYDSRFGRFDNIMEAPMSKQEDGSSRGGLYKVPWNYKAFEDPSADRFWLQIESTDITGRRTLTEPRPFSVNGLGARISWTWKEFLVMGCQWAALYYPILWSVLYVLVLLLVIPKALLLFSRKQHNSIAEKGLRNAVAWLSQELCKVPILWFGFLGYLFHLILFPWLVGKIYTDSVDRGYMTYMGWVVPSPIGQGKHSYIGFPDIMVIVLPHLVFVVLPTMLVTGGLIAERGAYRHHFLSRSAKKEDDYYRQRTTSSKHDFEGRKRSKLHFRERWVRKILFVLCLAILWKHFKNCNALMKAYEMNPVHFPGYSLGIPSLLIYAIYTTKMA